LNLCLNGFNPPTETWNPVAGAVEFLDDAELKGKLIEERQFLKARGFTAESSDLIIFRIAKGEAYFWTMETNFGSKKVIKFG